MFRFRDTIMEPRFGSAGASATPSMRKTPRQLGVSSPWAVILSAGDCIGLSGLATPSGVPPLGLLGPSVSGPVTGPMPPPLPAAVAGVIDIAGAAWAWAG